MVSLSDVLCGSRRLMECFDVERWSENHPLRHEREEVLAGQCLLLQTSGRASHDAPDRSNGDRIQSCRGASIKIFGTRMIQQRHEKWSSSALKLFPTAVKSTNCGGINKECITDGDSHKRIDCFIARVSKRSCAHRLLVNLHLSLRNKTSQSAFSCTNNIPFYTCACLSSLALRTRGF